MLDILVSLAKGIDRQTFVDSFNDNDSVYLYRVVEESNKLLMAIKRSYLSTFTADPRVADTETVPHKSGLLPTTLPPKPQLKYQQGTPVSGGRRFGFTDSVKENSQIAVRPYFGSSSSLDDQIRGIHQQAQMGWLGSHYMPYHVFVDSDSAGLNRFEDKDVVYKRADGTLQIQSGSIRPTIGNHPDDLDRDGAYGHAAGSPPSGTVYKSNYFGKDVDIIALEAGVHPVNQNLPENFDYLYHPNFGLAPDEVTDLNILGNDLQENNMGDAPDGPYNHIGTRIKLRDWSSNKSSGHALGDKNALLSRYNNANLGKDVRNPLTDHCMGTLSVAGGLISGFAKKANLYPVYMDSERSTIDIINDIRDFHKNKPRNPNIKYGNRRSDDFTQGVRNPTILIIEAQTTHQKVYFTPVERIKRIRHKGETVNRPAGGWGNDLTPFVDRNMIPFRLEDPENAGQFFWTISYGTGGSKRAGDGQNLRWKEAIERAWNDGIVVVTPAGNGCEVYAKRDDVEFNSYFETDGNAKFYKRTLNASAEITGYETITAGSGGEKVYPFRSYGPHGCKRNKSIDVAAGQNSETHPILDAYSSRGPGVDIIGSGSGNLSTKCGIDDREFYADTNLGYGSPLDPNATEFVSGTDWSGYQNLPVYRNGRVYPFSNGQSLRINDLGTSNTAQDDWNTYLGTSGETYAVGDQFIKPSSNANIPAGASANEMGWKYGLYGGTSCATPTVAGKIACMMEEYLHENGQWPTPNQAKDMLISQARVVDAEAPSTYWPDVDSPNFGSGAPEATRYICSGRVNYAFPDSLQVRGLASNRFQSQTGNLEVDMTGWEAVNIPPISLDMSTVGSVRTSANFQLPIDNIKKRSYSFDPEGTTRAVVEFARKTTTSPTGVRHGFAPGDAIRITGVNGMTQVNDNVYYVGNAGTYAFSLYQDAALTTLVDATSFGDYTNGGSIGFNSTVKADGTSSFRDSNNEIYRPRIGDTITVGGSGTELIDGTYKVVSVDLESTPKRFAVNAGSTGMTTTLNADVTNLGSKSLSVTQIPIVKNADGSVSVKLTNIAGQPGPAGISCTSLIQDRGIYDLDVKASNSVNLKIQQGATTHLNHNDITPGGTITPFKAYTMLFFAGLGQVGDDIVASSTLVWDQRLGNPDTFKTYGYRDSANSAVPDTNSNELVDLTTDPVQYYRPYGHSDTAAYSNLIGMDLWFKHTTNIDWFQTPNLKPLGPFPIQAGASWKWRQGDLAQYPAGIPVANQTIGSISSPTFTDASGATRTIRDLWWTAGQTHHVMGPDGVIARTVNGLLVFSLDGQNIPNTDDTFGALNVGTLAFQRSEARYFPNSHGNTAWVWNVETTPIDDSDFAKLGDDTGTTNFHIQLGTRTKNSTVFVDPGNAREAKVAFTVSNCNSTPGNEITIDRVNFRRRRTSDDSQLVTARALNNSNGTSLPTWDHFKFSDLAGTPPLRAVYNGAKNNFRDLARSGLDIVEANTGAIYPAMVDSVMANMSEADLSQGGWSRKIFENAQEAVEELISILDLTPTQEWNEDNSNNDTNNNGYDAEYDENLDNFGP